MFEEIYLEVDEEVTSVIEKIKKSAKANIVLSLPRNAVLGQSVVNLKLVHKEAQSNSKEVAIVTSDKVTRNLAERVGFVVYDSVKGISFAGSEKAKSASKAKITEELKPEPAETKNEETSQPLQRARFDSNAKSKEATTGAVAEAAAATSELASAGFVSQSLDVPHADEDVSSVEEVEHDDPEPKQPTAPPLEKSVADPSPSTSRMIPSRGNLRFFRQQKKKAAVLPIVIFLVLIICGLVTAAFMIPSASVKVTVKAQSFEETIKSSVDTEVTSVDVEKAVIPGKSLAIEQVSKSSAKATGKKDKGTKASGTLTLYNGWDSTPRTLAAGATIKAQKSANTFVLTKAVTIPGATSSISGGKAVIVAGQVAATVEASAPGEAYNEGANLTFIIPSIPTAQQDSIYGTSSAAFTGGTSSVVTVVSESDLTKLSENIKSQNKDEAVAEIKKQAGDSIVVDKAIQTLSQDIESSAQAGDEADSVEVTVTGKFSLVTFTKQDQQQLLEKLLASKIPEGQELVTQGDAVTPDTSNYELNLVSEKRLELTNNLKAFTAQKFDQNLVKRTLIGADPKEVQSIVTKNVPTLSVEVEKQPSWWPRLPLLGKKIDISYTYKSESVEATTPSQ